MERPFGTLVPVNVANTDVLWQFIIASRILGTDHIFFVYSPQKRIRDCNAGVWDNRYGLVMNMYMYIRFLAYV